MEQIQIKLENYQKKGATSQRAYWIDLTAKMLGRQFKMVAGLTRDWPEKWIEDIYLTAKSFEKNAPALWWKLYKQTKSNPQIIS